MKEKRPGLPDVRAFAVASIGELPECLPHIRNYFSLLLAWDAPNKLHASETSVLEALVNRGLIYFCSWGENCEQVHDTADMCDIDRLSRIGDQDAIVMTTWHKGETLEEAMWYFRYCAVPVESFRSHSYDRFAVSVGHPDWHQTMLEYFRRKPSGKKWP